MPQVIGGWLSYAHTPFMYVNHLGKLNMEGGTLSWIESDHKIEPETVKAICNAAVEGPGALIEVYA